MRRLELGKNWCEAMEKAVRRGDGQLPFKPLVLAAQFQPEPGEGPRSGLFNGFAAGNRAGEVLRSLEGP